MDILVACLILVFGISSIVCAYGKQQEKHRRMKEWMREVKKNDKNN